MVIISHIIYWEIYFKKPLNQTIFKSTVHMRVFFYSSISQYYFSFFVLINTVYKYLIVIVG